MNESLIINEANTIQLNLENSLPNVDLVTLLAAQSGLSKQAIKAAMKKGAVWLTKVKQTKRVRRAKTLLQPGERVHLYYNSDILDVEPAAPSLIANFNDFSIWNKPYGVLSQGSKWGDHTTINRLVELIIQPAKPVFILHRLDRATRGLMLLAHSKSANKALTQAFEQRQIDKTYRAIVHGQFPTEDVTIAQDIDGRQALSHAKRIDYSPSSDCSLVEVNIETGRKHQVRRHLSDFGYSIVGDRLYGNAVAGDRDLQLSAYQLRFKCPLTGQHIHEQLPKSLQLEWPI
jgi:tRNA pseudouridine32 synthase / 23S rRNA pseudouridine746 synthase